MIFAVRCMGNVDDGQYEVSDDVLGWGWNGDELVEVNWILCNFSV